MYSIIVKLIDILVLHLKKYRSKSSARHNRVAIQLQSLIIRLECRNVEVNRLMELLRKQCFRVLTVLLVITQALYSAEGR